MDEPVLLVPFKLIDLHQRHHLVLILRLGLRWNVTQHIGALMVIEILWTLLQFLVLPGSTDSIKHRHILVCIVDS